MTRLRLVPFHCPDCPSHLEDTVLGLVPASVGPFLVARIDSLPENLTIQTCKRCTGCGNVFCCILLRKAA